MTRLREPPWFEELSPQLLRNKAIRTFLQAYSDHEWPEVTKLVLLYGIVSLTRQYPGQVLSLAALREALSAGASAQAVETAIPDLQDKLSELRLQLDDVQDDLQPRGELRDVSRPPEARGPQVPGPSQPPGVDAEWKQALQKHHQAQHQQRAHEQRMREAAAEAKAALRKSESWLQYKARGLAVPPNEMPPKLVFKATEAAVAERHLSPLARCPSDWRTGDKRVTSSPPGKKRSPVMPGDGLQGADYPDWWGDGVARYPQQQRPGAWWPGGRSRSAPRPGRPPPRLAYSVQLEPQPRPLWQDDLITARYLDVPSSGYGRQHPAHQPRPAPGPAPPPPVDLRYPLVNPAGEPQPGSYPPWGPFNPAPAPGPYSQSVSDWSDSQPMQRLQRMGPPARFQGGIAGPFPGGGVGGGAGGGGVQGGLDGPQLYMVGPTGALVPVGPGGWSGDGMGGNEQDPQQQDGRAPWKAAHAAHVQSRIRSQVAADRAAARARATSRQRAAEAAVTGGPGGSGSGGSAASSVASFQQQQQRGGEGAKGSGSGVGSRPGTGAPSEIADSLAANPFTSWFMAPQGGGGGDDLQQGLPAQGQGQGYPQVGVEHPGQWQQQQQHQQQLGDGLRPSGSPYTRGLGGQQRFPWGPAPGDGQLGQSPLQPPTLNQWAWPGASSPLFPGNSQGPPQQPPWAVGAPHAAWGQVPQGPAGGPPGPWGGGAWAQVASPPALPQQPGWAWGGQQGAGIYPGAMLGLGPGAGPSPRPRALSPREEALRVVRPEAVKAAKSWVGDFGHLDEPRFPPRSSLGRGPGPGTHSAEGHWAPQPRMWGGNRGSGNTDPLAGPGLPGLSAQGGCSSSQPDPRVNITSMYGGGRPEEGQGPWEGWVGHATNGTRLPGNSVIRDRRVAGELEGGEGQRYAGSLRPEAAARAATAGSALGGGADRYGAPPTQPGERQWRPAASGAAAAVGVDPVAGQAGPSEPTAAASNGSAGASAIAGVSELPLRVPTGQALWDGVDAAASSGADHGGMGAAAGRDSAEVGGHEAAFTTLWGAADGAQGRGHIGLPASGDNATHPSSSRSESSSGSNGGGIDSQQRVASPLSTASLDSLAGDLPAMQPTGDLEAAAAAAASLGVPARPGLTAGAEAEAFHAPPSAPSRPTSTTTASSSAQEPQLGPARWVGGAAVAVEAAAAPMDTDHGALAQPVPVHTTLQPDVEPFAGDQLDASVDLGPGMDPALGVPGTGSSTSTPSGVRAFRSVAHVGEIMPAEEEGERPVAAWSGGAGDGAFYAVDLRDANGGRMQQQQLPDQRQHSQPQRQRVSEPGGRGSGGGPRSPHRRLWVGRPGQHAAPAAAATSAAVASGGYGNAALAATAAAAAAWEQEWAGALGSGGGAEGSPGASPGPSPRGWDWDGIVGRFAGSSQRR